LVFGSVFLEYRRYSPVLSFRIMFLQSAFLGKSCIRDAAPWRGTSVGLS
jgi:hypothetical protein